MARLRHAGAAISCHWVEPRCGIWLGQKQQAGATLPRAEAPLRRTYVDGLKAYITRQEEHHSDGSFQDEVRCFCRNHGLEIDERCVLG